MTLRRAHGSLLAAVCAALLLAFTAPLASAAIEPAPGGPILVVTSSTDHFSSYYTEILRNEGFNDFATADVSSLSASALNSHDTVLLAAPSVTDAQASLLSGWVQSGGNLIAMRPGANLASLLGLSSPSGILTNANLKIDTGSAPGAGITGSVLQYHGAADRWSLAGARAVATLYSDVSTATSSPAVSLNTVGHGHAAAFTFDLARSVVATRQGNIAWAGQNRDRDFADPITLNPDPVVRSNDLFFGGNEPDWVDLNRVAIPQADEQQRLLANLITQFSYTPTPHFWYFPKGDKAVIAMTGDDHGSGGTNDVVEHLYDVGPAGCQQPIDQTLVANWGCPRATSYVYPDNTPLTDDQAKLWTEWGFEISAHPLFQSDASCLDYNSTDQLRGWIGAELTMFHTKFPSLAGPTTTRTHCISWSDWDSQPKVDAENGIRLNTDYYWFPAAWTHNKAGLFTGSGMPMRFTAADGSLIDVYQATTYGADDAVKINSSDPTSANDVIPAIGKTLMDNALGADGYYGAFTIQVHSDEPADAPGRNALIADAMNRGVPVVSERQLLTWLDGRNASKFTDVSFGADGKLRFSVAADSRAHGLQAMLPVQGSSGALSGLTRNGVAVSYSTQTIKGVPYAILPDAAGDYVASYPAPARPHPNVDGGPADPTTPNGGPNPPAPPSGAGTTTPTATKGASTKGSTKATIKAWVSASSLSFRPGAKRTFVIKVKLPITSRLVVSITNDKGKVVRRLTAKRHKAGTVVRLRWNGKDSRGHYVKAGKYRYTVRAIGTTSTKTTKGSVRLLTAR